MDSQVQQFPTTRLDQHPQKSHLIVMQGRVVADDHRPRLSETEVADVWEAAPDEGHQEHHRIEPRWCAWLLPQHGSIPVDHAIDREATERTKCRGDVAGNRGPRRQAWHVVPADGHILVSLSSRKVHHAMAFGPPVQSVEVL
jgi:hypothetical protein